MSILPPLAFLRSETASRHVDLHLARGDPFLTRISRNTTSATISESLPVLADARNDPLVELGAFENGCDLP